MAAKPGVRLNWGGLDGAMQGAVRKLANRKHLLNAIGEALVSSTTKRFLDETDPEGKAWKETKRGGKILQDTARLRNSIDYKTTTANSSVLVGSNLAYARIHHLGGMAGRNRSVEIDARAYLGISDDDRDEIAALVSEYMMSAFR